MVNSNHKTEQLEKALRFSDNTKNKLNLAAAYMELGRYTDAAHLYESTLTGFMEDDPGVRMKLLEAHFMAKSYEQAITLGEILESEKTFKNAEARYSLQSIPLFLFSLCLLVFHHGQPQPLAFYQ